MLEQEKGGVTKMFHDNRRSRKLAQKEISILRQLQKVDSSYIVKYSKHFLQKSYVCINFELLDQTLLDYLWSRPDGLPMVDLRSIIWQMAGALSHLKTAGILHAALRPGNIMVVDTRQQPARIKLIDFGMAFNADSPSAGPDVGTSGCRAPEINLGMPLSGAIDVWSLGASAVYLATSDGDDAELSEIISCVGDHPMTCWTLTSLYFHKQSNEQKRWRLKSPLDFEEKTGQEARTTESIRLDDIPELMIHGDTNEKNLFVDLLKKMMQLDADKRITPLEVLQHPFLTTGLCQGPEGSSSRGEVTAEAPGNHSHTETKPGNADGGEKHRCSRFSSRITEWIGRIELCFTCLHQQSAHNTENPPQKPKRAANSGHEHQMCALYQCPVRGARNS